MGNFGFAFTILLCLQCAISGRAQDDNSPPSEITRFVGEKLHYRLQLKGNTAPNVISFRKDNMDVSKVAYETSKAGEAFSLVIANLNQASSGTYNLTLMGAEKEATPMSYIFNLTVQELPEVTSYRTQHNIKYGSDLEFKVNISGEASPIGFELMKDGFALGIQKYSVSIEPSGQMLVKVFDVQEDGMYILTTVYGGGVSLNIEFAVTFDVDEAEETAKDEDGVDFSLIVIVTAAAFVVLIAIVAVITFKSKGKQDDKTEQKYEIQEPIELEENSTHITFEDGEKNQDESTQPYSQSQEEDAERGSATSAESGDDESDQK